MLELEGDPQIGQEPRHGPLEALARARARLPDDPAGLPQLPIRDGGTAREGMGRRAEPGELVVAPRRHPEHVTGELAFDEAHIELEILDAPCDLARVADGERDLTLRILHQVL